MVLLSVCLALLLEQLRPLRGQPLLERRLRRWAAWVTRQADTGRGAHAALAWALAVGGPALLVAGVHALLKHWAGWPLALLWSVLVLHLGLGLQQLGRTGTQLRQALEHGNTAQVRHLLARWQQRPQAQVAHTGLTRQALELTLLLAHRQVFGLLFWFVLLASWGLGPAGVVLYKQAAWLARHWPRPPQGRQPGTSPALGRAARRAWRLVDGLPVRLTALGLALVGRFEPALQAWRTHATGLGPGGEGVLLACGAASLGVALAPPMPGVAPLPDHIRAALALVWRLLGLWLLLLVLLSLGGLL